MARDGKWRIPGARAKVRYDIAVFNRRCALTLAVAMKTPSMPDVAIDADWAVNIRRNLLRHAALPRAPYFLIAAFPGSFFLWKDSLTSEADKQPDFIIQDEAARQSWAGLRARFAETSHSKFQQQRRVNYD